MAVKEGYDVLRLIEHGQVCYISSEYVAGKPLAVWLKYHPRLSKEQLLGWILCMARQLEMLHKCKNHPCCRYVNPYSMIISEEGGLYLADMQAGSNEDLLRLMRRKSIREHFLPPEEPYYRKASVALDAYGLGRTIQYLLAMSEPDPPLGRRETAKLQKLISRCLKLSSGKPIQSISEIRKYIPVYQETQKRAIQKGRKILAAAALLTALGALGRWGISGIRDGGARALAAGEEAGEGSGENVNEAETSGEIKADGDKEKDRKETEKERIRLALAYFLEIGDYQKVQETLEPVLQTSRTAEELSAVAEAFLSPDTFAEEETETTQKDTETSWEAWKHHLEQLEELASEGGWNEEEEVAFWRCLIHGYQLSDEEEAAKEVIRLGESCLEQDVLEEAAEQDVRADMAGAYERTGEEETAAEWYARLLEQTEEKEERKEYFAKAAALYEQCGKTDLALELCAQGIKEFPQERALQIQHIRLLCQDPSVDRGICAQTIREYLSRDSTLADSEEFQKLQKEYGIKVEGEEVWVGE